MYEVLNFCVYRIFAYIEAYIEVLNLSGFYIQSPEFFRLLYTQLHKLSS